MKVVFLEEAAREFSAAIVHYDKKEPGLGLRFADEVDRAIRWLAGHPHAFPLRRGLYRRMNLHIFPYYIPYVIRESVLWVVAIAPARRRPEFWIGRTELAS